MTAETSVGISTRASPTPNLLICTLGSPTLGKGMPLVPSKNIHLCGYSAEQGQPVLGGRQGSHPSGTKGLCPPH